MIEDPEYYPEYYEDESDDTDLLSYCVDCGGPAYLACDRCGAPLCGMCAELGLNHCHDCLKHMANEDTP